MLHFVATLTYFIVLVENGVDLEAQDDYGSRALHFAARFGHLPFIQELISRYHVDINARKNDGRTALWEARHCAKCNHNPALIDFLLDNGGNDRVEDDDDDEEEEEEEEDDDEEEEEEDEQ
jgi:ankyrin repeat protein